MDEVVFAFKFQDSFKLQAYPVTKSFTVAVTYNFSLFTRFILKKFFVLEENDLHCNFLRDFKCIYLE